jgi:ribosome-binding ATPase YchF (GTP1/OBG family)
MRIALLGLEGSGKTTVFNAVAETPVPLPPATLQTETHVQVVRVRDPRLERCRDLFQPKKYTPAGVELWDPPGLPAGGSEADREKRQRRLSALRELDAYVLVVRDFLTDRYPYERVAADPAADLRRLAEELISADYVIARTRADKLDEQILRKTRTLDQDRLEAGVADACPLRLRALTTMDAQIDAELNAMAPADRPAFMEEFGIETPAAERLVRDVYRAVGLVSFFTVGEDEVRAWTIREGDNAVTAAGRIHTDLAKGFVRAEVFAYQALEQAGSMRDLKAAGGIRLEGKEYLVKDGDIVHIRSAI